MTEKTSDERLDALEEALARVEKILFVLATKQAAKPLRPVSWPPDYFPSQPFRPNLRPGMID